MYTRSRITLFVLLFSMLSIILSACATPGASELPVAQPTEVIALPTPTGSDPTPGQELGLRPMTVEAVQVEMGEGSPLPVEVVASGTWPDLCAQVARIEQRFSGQRIEINLLAAPLQADCPPDYVGVPFRIAIPLNMAELPAGMYAVSVNGVETGFAWDFVTSAENTPGESLDGALQPLVVEAATVDIGVGSPIPVEVVASGSWPELCAQLASIEQIIDGNQIEISLLATPSDPGCPADAVGIPFRVAVPLNIVEMPVGEYEVAVNGTVTHFEWTGSAPEAEQPASPLAVAYIGQDGNLWIADGEADQPRQITSDATPPNAYYDPPEPVVSYYFPAISSDGQYVAVRQDAATPVDWGMEYQFELQVYSTQSGEMFQVVGTDNPPAGADWQPGTHLLAYGIGTAPAYFTARGVTDASLATGIFGWDLDSRETRVLVEPQRGYAMMLPVWSPDGRFLSFDEIMYMEGRQPFAYYDFETGEYFAIDEPLGSYDWSPDGSQIAYDRLTYTATGEERIYIRERVSGEETLISSGLDLGPGYAFYPVFSPDGSHLAFFANLSGPEAVENTLYVQELSGGEPRELGIFESAQNLQWSPDGTQLIFSAGPYETAQVMAVNVQDGSSTVLGQGSQPRVAQP